MSLPGLAQKPANVSPTVWNIGIAGKFQPLFHFQVTIVYIFSFFTSFPPKKKQTTLWRDELFPVFFFPREPPVTVTQPIHPSTWEAEPPHQGRYFRQAGFFRRDPYRKSDGYFRQWILSPNCLFASKIIMVFRCVFLELLFFVG